MSGYARVSQGYVTLFHVSFTLISETRQSFLNPDICIFEEIFYLSSPVKSDQFRTQGNSVPWFQGNSLMKWYFIFLFDLTAWNSRLAYLPWHTDLADIVTPCQILWREESTTYTFNTMYVTVTMGALWSHRASWWQTMNHEILAFIC